MKVIRRLSNKLVEESLEECQVIAECQVISTGELFSAVVLLELQLELLK